MLVEITCHYCGKTAKKPAYAVNRASRINANVYCDKACASIGRRKNKTMVQKKTEKRIYDKAYRQKNKELLAQKKANYHKRTYNPVAAAIHRKKNMQRHVLYCRRPEYRKKKAEYDRPYRARKIYGEFWESFCLIEDIRREVSSRMTDIEVRKVNGKLNAKQQRRRQYDKERSGSINS